MPKRLAIILLVGTVLRLVLAWFAPPNFDQLSYAIVVGILDHGGNVYAETARYNYSPVWMGVLWFIAHASRPFGITFPMAVRSFLTAVDIADALVIGAIAARSGLSREKAVAAFFLNPISVLLTGMHGQFENLAALPLLLALWLTLAHPATRSRWLWLLGTLALIIKHILTFSVWGFFVGIFAPRRAALAFAATVALFSLSFVPFLPAGGADILQNVFLYSGGHGLAGVGMLFNVIPNQLLASHLLMALFVPAMFGLGVLLDHWRVDLPRRLEILAVAFIALSPGLGQQYFILPILFGSWRPAREQTIYTLAVLPILVFELITLSGWDQQPLLPLWNLAWAGAAFWFVASFLRIARRRNSSEGSVVATAVKALADYQSG